MARSRPRWLLVLSVPLAFAALLWAALQLDVTRNALIALFDATQPETAAATVDALTPAAFDGPDAERTRIAVRLEPAITGVVQPTDVAPVPGHDGAVVVLSKTGTASLSTPGAPLRAWFTLDVPTRSELGLLGIAFHPKFADNGLFFVDATPQRDGEPHTVISRWRTDPATLAAPHQEGVVLEVAQPYANHDAGQIAFGPDGMLYVSLGDGGYRGDPQGNGQNRGTLLASLLRLDVDSATPYAVPPDNPLVGVAGARPEIWAWGLRNPWRFAFDPQGRIVAGDVGQNTYEEVDLIAAGDNLGWNVREGFACYEPSDCERLSGGLVDPIWSYGRDAGASITGGVVWTAPGPLQGRYLVGDYVTGRLWALTLPSSRRRLQPDEVAALGRFALSPTAFGRMPDGTVWVADFQRGAVFRIVQTVSPPPP
ncbi:MAG: PQQ-dependent sugar dehydrogenase [Myxococcota bacterium]